jgi:hypothetical protein
MENGFYAIYYTGATGNGMGLLAAKDSVVTGADISGGLYDGSFQKNPLSGQIDINIRMAFPPGTSLVTGAIAGAQPLVLQLTSPLPANFADGTPVGIQTPTGPVNVIFKKLREFP